MIRVEFHCHTIYSKDSLTSVESLLAACQRKSIDRVVITDHNTIAGAIRAQALAPERVIVGEEIMTQAGEILAAFVQEEVPPGLSARETIARLRDQGAFISVSHPFDHYRKGHWPLPDLLDIAPLVDAIEVFNARCLSPDFNRQAGEFAREHGLAGTVGSDAHVTWELGRALLEMPDFQDAGDLRRVLPQAKHSVRLSGFWVHLTSRYAVWKKRQSQKAS